jgi:hypothetical protein
VLSDDCVKLVENDGRYRAIPTYPSLRLWPDVVDGLSVDSVGSIPVAGYSSKRRIDVTNRSPATGEITSVELMMGILLEEMIPSRAASQNAAYESTISLRTLGKQATVVELLKQTFFLDARDRDSQQRTFGGVERLTRTLPFCGLTYARGLDQMPKVAAELIEQLGKRPFCRV